MKRIIIVAVLALMIAGCSFLFMDNKNIMNYLPEIKEGQIYEYKMTTEVVATTYIDSVTTQTDTTITTVDYADTCTDVEEGIDKSYYEFKTESGRVYWVFLKDRGILAVSNGDYDYDDGIDLIILKTPVEVETDWHVDYDDYTVKGEIKDINQEYENSEIKVSDVIHTKMIYTIDSLDFISDYYYSPKKGIVKYVVNTPAGGGDYTKVTVELKRVKDEED